MTIFTNFRNMQTQLLGKKLSIWNDYFEVFVLVFSLNKYCVFVQQFVYYLHKLFG